MTKLIKPLTLIYSDEARAGKGIPEDPLRIIEKWFTTEGMLVYKYDPFLEPHPDNLYNILKELADE